MLAIMLIISLVSQSISYTSHNCFTGCETCEIIFFFVYCTQCVADRRYNQTSGLCDCNSNTYDSGTSCIACPSYCLTCSQLSCTSCSSDRYLDHYGICQCNNGKGLDSSGNCQTSSPINLSLILGIGIGCSLGLSCIVTIICMVRKRNLRLFDQHSQQGSEIGQIRANQIYVRSNQVRPIVVEVIDNDENSSTNTFKQNCQKKYQFKEETCSICLEDFAFFQTKCGHFFHQQCIVTWIKKRDHCPNCNATISADKIMKWCNSCKKQPIFPQRYRIISSLSNKNIPEAPIFWPTCTKCQKSMHELK